MTLRQAVDNDIVVNEYTVSSQHCAFHYDRYRTTVTDLDSLNGTRVDGRAIEPHRPVKLRDGMELTLGRRRLRYLTAKSFIKLVNEDCSAAA